MCADQMHFRKWNSFAYGNLSEGIASRSVPDQWRTSVSLWWLSDHRHNCVVLSNSEFPVSAERSADRSSVEIMLQVADRTSSQSSCVTAPGSWLCKMKNGNVSICTHKHHPSSSAQFTKLMPVDKNWKNDYAFGLIFTSCQPNTSTFLEKIVYAIGRAVPPS